MPRKRKSYVWSRLVWRELPAEEIPELGADDFLASDETIGTTPINKNKQTIYCDSFSDDNQNVTVLCRCWGSCACFDICHCCSAGLNLTINQICAVPSFNSSIDSVLSQKILSLSMALS